MMMCDRGRKKSEIRSFETPTTKHQAPEKSQIPNINQSSSGLFEGWILQFLWCLDVGAWFFRKLPPSRFTFHAWFPSGFELRIYFGFRASGFGFRTFSVTDHWLLITTFPGFSSN